MAESKSVPDIDDGPVRPAVNLRSVTKVYESGVLALGPLDRLCVSGADLDAVGQRERKCAAAAEAGAYASGCSECAGRRDAGASRIVRICRCVPTPIVRRDEDAGFAGPRPGYRSGHSVDGRTVRRPR